MSSLLFFLAILSFAAADFCPKDTVTDRARLKCYKFINTQRNFTEAKNLCKEFGGNIANLPNDTGLLQKVKGSSTSYFGNPTTRSIHILFRVNNRTVYGVPTAHGGWSCDIS
ncbi:hypothetical protein QR680_018618 [Steinernema hermaphroditum]|uniref:C-type lectin domain-containing protein n=1 Tax=Steinernema hermaphroditum TaxID=289476 RepID=A0AA39HJS9_9BILA|nr:hypothetical protein QR680_018618 [Steinernema hermaphroditum]